jgi:hypothetical protein
MDKDRQLISPPIKKEKDIKREKDVKKEVKAEKDHREQHRAKDAKVAESELVRDLKAQLKYVISELNIFTVYCMGKIMVVHLFCDKFKLSSLKKIVKSIIYVNNIH